ncbi:hypothetical protein GGX14DRAFT_401594 [Mycena pura]|uniref:Uncharacterized protein n=1 Tax=Mycena pura TaxID=153505 RepID=A0AAD6V422_9AGAR|nr:hypothetical protein GGX14DRAFT_401594 [Mycena pura]
MCPLELDIQFIKGKIQVLLLRHAGSCSCGCCGSVAAVAAMSRLLRQVCGTRHCQVCGTPPRQKLIRGKKFSTELNRANETSPRKGHRPYKAQGGMHPFCFHIKYRLLKEKTGEMDKCRFAAVQVLPIKLGPEPMLEGREAHGTEWTSAASPSGCAMCSQFNTKFLRNMQFFPMNLGPEPMLEGREAQGEAEWTNAASPQWLCYVLSVQHGISREHGCSFPPMKLGPEPMLEGREAQGEVCTWGGTRNIVGTNLWEGPLAM